MMTGTGPEPPTFRSEVQVLTITPLCPHLPKMAQIQISELTPYMGGFFVIGSHLCSSFFPPGSTAFHPP